MSFDPVHSRYLEVVPILKDETTGFSRSPEYRLWNDLLIDNLPGVVAAAFAQFLARTAREGSETGSVEAGVRALSQLASWADSDVDTMLRDEVFDHLREHERAIEILRPMMSERLRNLYDRWAKSIA